MINILVASDDTARLTQIARLVTDCGRYRATRATGRPSQIEHRTDGLDAFAILLVDGTSLDAPELAAIERICRVHTGLTCILVTADASPHVLLDAMRAGDLARARAVFQAQLPLLQFIVNGGLPVTVKAGLRLCGFDAGEPRKPLMPLGDARTRELERLLAALPDGVTT
ncbi:hypothetical protein D7S84_27250 [Ralstonia pickettii]|nr:hypothetical protein [Ralstonia pickettii]